MRYQAMLTVALVAIAGSAASAQNVGARLFDGPAVLDYTTGGTGFLPTTSNGSGGNVPMNFQVGGVPGDPLQRQVFSGNWFYRVQGDSRERHFANAGTQTFSGANEVEWTFPQVFTGGPSPFPVSDVTADMGFQVNSTGANTAYFYTWACIYNSGSAPIDVDMFFAVDIDLDATGAGDVYDPLIVTGDRKWRLTDGSTTGVMFGPGADGAGMDGFGAIMGSMTDAGLDDYIPDVNPWGGPGSDLAGIMQWRETIHPGTKVCFPCYVGIGLNGEEPIVPAPGAPLIVGAGLLTGAMRRRRV